MRFCVFLEPHDVRKEGKLLRVAWSVDVDQALANVGEPIIIIVATAI